MANTNETFVVQGHTFRRIPRRNNYCKGCFWDQEVNDREAQGVVGTCTRKEVPCCFEDGQNYIFVKED